MNKKILEELEFEKNKREILKRTKASINESKRKQIPNDVFQSDVFQSDLFQSDTSHGETIQGESKKYAWEYELENYRKSKTMDKFHTFGAICGILALILTVLINWNDLIQFLL